MKDMLIMLACKCNLFRLTKLIKDQLKLTSDTNILISTKTYYTLKFEIKIPFPKVTIFAIYINQELKIKTILKIFKI